MKLSIAICGFGNAGRTLANSILESDEYDLAYVLCRCGSSKSGKDIGECMGTNMKSINIYESSNFNSAQEAHPADVMIDFSVSENSPILAEMCAAAGLDIVICTTNLQDEDLEKMKRLTEQYGTGIAIASNLTKGINLLLEYAEDMSAVLDDFDFAVEERHRRGKAPITGTARNIAKATGREDIPITCMRIGGYTGYHEITAASQHERITVIHESFSREAFADGALMAADHIYKNKGFCCSRDILRQKAAAKRRTSQKTAVK